MLWWLPDLTRWAEIIASHLKPGGVFYIHEIHPVASVLGDESGELMFKWDYFGSDEPMQFETTGTYYDAPGFAAEPGTECGWIHTLGDVVTSLADAGLRIEFLREHPTAAFRMLPCFERDDAGHWRPEGAPSLPLTFSLKARR